MKTNKYLLLLTAVFISPLFFAETTLAQSEKDSSLIKDCQEAKAEFTKTDEMLKNLYESAAGYVIFPNVGKGAVGVGGAAGNGIVYEKNKAIGKASMKQVSIGFQFGGQAYRELIFFEDAKTLDNFKKNKFEFSAQASAVAIKTGASANAKYANGVMVFTAQKGGLMYEASIGGQKFKFSTF